VTTLPREWRVPFGTWPAWMCPTCQKSTLNLIADTLKSEETGESKASQTHEAWDPDWTVARFSALFRCANRDCGEVVTCTGNMRVVDDGEDGYEPRYTPLYFHPPLKFFRMRRHVQQSDIGAAVEIMRVNRALIEAICVAAKGLGFSGLVGREPGRGVSGPELPRDILAVFEAASLTLRYGTRQMRTASRFRSSQ
jgi:hypothetical protein